MTDLVGRTLGPYQIIAEIGHGGMANVYRATQPSIGREVAVKVLPPHFLQDRTFVKRFTREVQVIARLQHPHILPVYDFGQQDGLPYIVMAYMPGGTLADRIRRDGALPLADVSRLIDQIAGGLEHAHQKGIIHRDFKPSNVLLDENGNVYLADFGIAKVAESTTELTGSGIVGTPAYMAPEVTRTDKVTPLIDIYALGVTLFEMLAGQHPYASETPVGLLLAHASAPIPDVRHYCPDLPPEVQSVIDRAMAKEPAERYQNAGELAADLRAVLAGELPLTTPVPRPAGSGHITTLQMAPTAPVKAGPRSSKLAVIASVIVGLAMLAGLAALGVPSMIAQTITGWSLVSGVTTTPTIEASSTVEASPTPLFERILAGHSDAVTSVALSPDGMVLASGSLDKTVILWDLQTDQPIRTLEMPDQVYSMVFYADGNTLLVGGESGITSLWDTKTGEQLFKQESLPSGQISVAAAPDQSAYAIASRDMAVAFMEANAYTWLKALTYPNPVWSLAYSPDGTMVAAGMSDGSLSLRDAQTDEDLYAWKEQSGGIKNLAFSPDGKQLASASQDGTVILWNLTEEQEYLVLSQHTGPVNSVAWAPSGRLVATSSDDGTIILWNPVTGEVVNTFDGGNGEIAGVVFGLDGTLLASGMQDGTVVIWKVE